MAQVLGLLGACGTEAWRKDACPGETEVCVEPCWEVTSAGKRWVGRGNKGGCMGYAEGSWIHWRQSHCRVLGALGAGRDG